MIKLRLQFDERAIPGFLTQGSAGQFVELYEIFGFPEAITIVVPKSLPKDVYRPYTKAFGEKGKQVHLSSVSVPEIPTLSGITKLFNQLPLEGPAANRLLVLFGGGRFFNAVDYCIGLMRSPPHAIHLPTTLTAQIEFPFSRKSYLFSEKIPNLFKLQKVHREFLWGDVQVLQHLSENIFRTGLLALIRLAVILDRQLFLFIESKVQLLIQRDAGTLLQLIYKIYQVKKNILFPTELHVILEKWNTESLFGFWGIMKSQIPELTLYDLFIWENIWRWRYMLTAGEADQTDFKRVLNLLKTFHLLEAASGEVFVKFLQRLKSLPGVPLSGEVILPRSIGKVVVKTGLDENLFWQSLASVESYLS
ncbi:MAG TPA: hypothetical protein ENH53_03950 [Bacteroidetes bacterium]|nr:hypothetical protein [Bacteroidota bacterium]